MLPLSGQVWHSRLRLLAVYLPHRLWVTYPTHSAIKSLVTFSGRFLYFNTAHGERPAFIPVYFRANFTRFCGLSVILNAYVSYLSNEQQRGTAFGQLQSSVALACLCGPVLGGIFMDQWRVEVLLNATAFVVMTLILIASFVLTNPVKTEAPKPKRNLSFQLSLIEQFFMVKRWNFGSSRWLWFGVLLCFIH